MSNLVIAIDGPAGAGKSTISKLVSNKLGINYIDTGAMYRAVTLKCLEKNIDLSDDQAIIETCEESSVKFADNSIYLDGVNVDDEIRTGPVTQNVSRVSSVPRVREIMVQMQRELGNRDDVILDGRDVGTAIFPNTKFKFFLNATAEERGRRRFEEIKDKDKNVTLESIIEDVKRRDYLDSTRECSPLVKAEDAIEIDTTDMSIDQVVSFIVDYVQKNR